MNKGSEFIVRAPRVLDIAGTEPQGGGPRRVLVVDDNEDAAMTLAELLKMLGNDARVAHDGEGALAVAREYGPDVMLLDIGLPDINGYEVARKLRAMPDIRQPRLVALTGWGQDQDKKQAAEAGFDEHWTKPVDPSKLQDLG